MYAKTNEDLLDAYLDIDFKDKEVFSVLASSDQVFTARYLDAKKVDAFDINRLTLYYFYLRLWSIKYDDKLYPDMSDKSNEWLSRLLNKVRPQSGLERRALDFYKLHSIYKTDIENLFYAVEGQEEGRTLYTKADELKDCTSSDLEFRTLNLFERNAFDDKYDIALISNILEWADNDPEKLENACENLDSLLKKDGIIICSDLIYRPPHDIDREQEIFSKSFDCEKKGKSYIYRKK